MDLKELITGYNELNDTEQSAFRMLLEAKTRQFTIDELNQENKQIQQLNCPHCGTERLVSNGKQKGVQRYLCRVCNKNFSEYTGSSVAFLKKRDLWSSYIESMLKGYSLRKCAEETGISLQTSFNWRHKILSSLQTSIPQEFNGITESDDIFFDFSEKGKKDLDRPARKRGTIKGKVGIHSKKIAVIVTSDRNGNKEFKLATMGRISKIDIEKAIGDKLSKTTVLCTDSHRSYSAFAKNQQLKHQKIKAGKGQYVKDKIYHIQTVNSATARLRTWIRGFNGVSTKYLQNYLNWFMLLEQIKDKSNQLKSFAIAALISKQAWEIFNNIEINHTCFRT